jgi:hypothetical protein
MRERCDTSRTHTHHERDWDHLEFAFRHGFGEVERGRQAIGGPTRETLQASHGRNNGADV